MLSFMLLLNQTASIKLKLQINIANMVIVYPYKKPKLEICDYNYCDGNHRISKCDGTQCNSNHTKSKKPNKEKNSANSYLKYALKNRQNCVSKLGRNAR